MMSQLKSFSSAVCLLIVWWPVAPLNAEEPQVSPEVAAMTPGHQHAFLAEQAGTWNVTLYAWMDPAAAPIQGTGTLKRQMILGGRVLEEVMTAQLMGMPYEAVGHVGYDNVTGKYWATSFDNLSTGITTLKGDIDESTGKGTLIGGTPQPFAGKEVTMRLEIYNEDGKQVMETHLPTSGQETMISIKAVYERQ